MPERLVLLSAWDCLLNPAESRALADPRAEPSRRHRGIDELDPEHAYSFAKTDVSRNFWLLFFEVFSF